MPRRKTKLPDRYKPYNPKSRTSKTRLEELQKSYPGIDVETEKKPVSGQKKKKETRSS